MKNILLDLNILLDYYEQDRREKFPSSVKVFDFLKNKDFGFISSSSIDNFEFLKFSDITKRYPNMSRKDKLKIVHNYIKEILTLFKIAKTPSYIEIDFEDIEDSQIIASAKAIDATVITRDEGMLKKYPDMTIYPSSLDIQPSISKIDFANLKKQHYLYHDEIEKEIDSVLNKTNFIMGDPVRELEANLQKFTGAKHAITCSSGTDALLLAMMALNIQPDDEIITTPFTFIATAETIAFLGAKPVFVDIDEKTYNIDPSKIEAAITPKTKAIMPVSLYGQPSNMDEINEIVNKILKTKNQKLYTIIDGAQSFGATYKEKSEVHYTDIYTTSFFPAKPLGCFGDGGVVLTNDQKLATKIQSLRVHGQSKRYHHKYIGMGGRMDTIQCAIVNVKLKHYKKDLALRQEVASKYTNLLKTKNQKLTTPIVKDDRTSAWAQYSVRLNTKIEKRETNNKKPITRNQIQTKLKEAGIPTAVHYPMPLHLQECFTYLGYKEGDFPIAEIVSREIMSLPMNPYLSDDEISYIATIL